MSPKQKDTIREELQTRINHTAKLVPQSQRELFLSEIEIIVKEAYQQGAKDKVEEVEQELNKFVQRYVPDMKMPTDYEPSKTILPSTLFVQAFTNIIKR